MAVGAIAGTVADVWGAVSGLFGRDDARDRAIQDAAVRDAASAPSGWLALQRDLATGIFHGKTIKDWAGGRGEPEGRDFFRLVAVRVGAIDAGYRQRGDAGAQQALSAAQSAALAMDRRYGSRLADAVRAQDPEQFTAELLRINLGSGTQAAPDYYMGVGSDPRYAPTQSPTQSPTFVAGALLFFAVIALVLWWRS